MTRWMMFLFLMVSLGLAQETQPKVATIRPGGWSLQFQITQNFTLTSFQGATISAKKHWSRNNALRFGVSLSGDYEKSEVDKEFQNDYYFQKDSYDSDVKGLNLGLSALYLHYYQPGAKVSLYLGGGPVVGYSRTHGTIEKIFVQDSVETWSNETNKRDIWKFGISGVVGVEWFVHTNVGILAEYYPSVYFSSSHSERTGENFHQTDNSRDFGLSNTVKFGVSVYF